MFYGIIADGISRISKMKITVVRHGQTNYNVAGLHNSDPSIDVHLTDAGIDEAKRIAEELKNEPFDALFVSELPRTKQTADYINKYHKLPIKVDARLNDINSGFEGRTVEEYHSKRNASLDIYTFRYEENAESSEDVYKRTKSFIDDLKKLNYSNALIVTSKHNFRHFRNIIDGLDPRASLSEHIPNVEVLVRNI